LDLTERNRARATLISFAGYVDPPQADWYSARHLRQLANVLEQVQQRRILRAIITLPPRHWKSSLTTKWESKLLGDNPKEKIISASRALNLALKFSKLVRQTMQSSRYHELYPATRIQRGSESAEDWMLEGGYQSSYRAVGTGGGIAGEGATVLVLDDVSDPNKQTSDTETENDWEWYKNVIRTRLEPDGVIVVVNNRVGPNDLPGYLLDPERNDSADPPEDWTVINIPAMDEATGEYLWEARFGRKYYGKLQNDPHLWQIQYQQKTTLDEGKEIKREWFEFVPQLPEGVREQMRVVDTAWTLKKTEKQDPDFTASIGSATHENWLYLIDPFEQRQEMPATVDWIKAKKKDKPYVRFGMAKAAGEKIATQFLTLLGIPIEELTAESADLRVRLSVFIYYARMGRVKLVGDKSKWERFMAQATAFPNGKHDDLLAVCAGLTEMHGLKIDKPLPPKPPRRLPIAIAKQRGIRQ